MKKLILGMSATALVAAGGLVAAQTAKQVAATDKPLTATAIAQTERNPNIRLAAAETTAEAFRKLDTDQDGRISALEANASPRVAAAFPMADKDKDGYLSREEFEALSSTSPQTVDVDASTPSGDRASDPSGDQPATPP